MSLRQRAEQAFAASRPNPVAASLSVDERARAESAVRPKVRRWCQRMGTTTDLNSIALEREAYSESRVTVGWFRFTAEDLEFWARTDSNGQFDVFLAGSTPHDGPVESLIDLGRALANRTSGPAR